MCDLADVEQALVELVGAAAYPNGTGQPSAVALPVKAYRGWPLANQLDTDMTATPPKVNVTVFPLSGMTRITTRYPRDWVADGPGPTSLTASITGSTVTIGGAPGVPQMVGIKSAGRGYVYPASNTDTPEIAAAALAALVPGATVLGATVICPADPKLMARVVGYSTIRRELMRQVQGFRITAWCPDRASRDAVGALISLTLAQNPFLALPDGGGRLLYAAADVDDVPTKDRLWRRDFRVTVEYPTTEVMTAPAMLWGIINQSVDGPVPDVTI